MFQDIFQVLWCMDNAAEYLAGPKSQERKSAGMTLTRTEVRSFYDRFGKKQDTQSFYEDPALDDLIGHAAISEAEKVFEFGCGTGRLADRLLSEHLPASVTYLGCDMSQTMVRIAANRLAIHEGRGRVLRSDGGMRLPLADNSVDRVISTYVLDLLPEPEIREFLHESSRVLKVGGKLCLVSLTKGTTFLSMFVSGIWAAVFHWHPAWVGGCRPIRLEEYIASDAWEMVYRKVVVAFGVPSEVLIARTQGPSR
jgi:ubiquinone/menaquinone biosynthesis C-methylase UbiE